jgi:PAS domain S-box-containing protein
MNTPLNVLILEDRPADAELMVEELRKAGFASEWRRVDTERDYLSALDSGLDVVLSDHSLPQFNSVRALERLQERGLDVPFIIVSGTIGEDMAVGLMKKGAADYVCKDRMARLGQAVVQAVQKKHLRQDKRRVEQALRDEQAWFRALTEKIQDGILVVDAEAVVLYASPSCFRLVGFAPESLAGNNVFSFVHPDDSPAAGQAFEALVGAPGSTASATVRWRHADDSWRWLEFAGVNRLAEPPLNGVLVTYRDVTERMLAEEHSLLRTAALEAAANGIVITDCHGAIVCLNNAFTRMTGYAHEELVGKNPRLLKSGKQDRTFYKNLWNTIIAGKVWNGELVNRRKDGTLYNEEMIITPVCARGNGVTHFIAIKQDVTERKRAEESLRASEERFALAIEGANDGIWDWKLATNELYFSPRFKSAIGYEDHEIEASYGVWETRLHSDDRAGTLAQLHAYLEGRSANYQPEYRLQCKDGSYRWFLARAAALRDANGKPTRLTGSHTDITRRKQAEESLVQSEEQIRLLLNSTAEAIYGIDIHGWCTFANSSCLHTLGYGRVEELLGKCMHDVLHHSHADGTPYAAEECPISRALREGKGFHIDSQVFWHANGTSFPVECWSYPIRRGDAVVGAVVTFLDITERKRVQDALAERALLAALTADVGIILTQEASLRGILQRGTEALVHHLGAAFARIWTVNQAGDTLELQASAGLYTHIDGAHARVPVGKYKIGLIAQERMPHLTNQVLGDPRVHDQEWARREGMVAFAGHPLIVGDRLRGVMAVFSRQTLSENTLGTLAAVANQVALGIERAQAEDELRASEERFRRITTNMLDLVVQVNLEGIYEYVTPSALSVIGYRPEELLGQSFFRLLYPDDLERAVAAFGTAMETGVPSLGEYRFRKANGEYLWLEVVGTRLLDNEGDVCGALIASRNVTARRHAEDEILKLNAELEQKVNDRTAQLEAANKELEAFAYSVSHDLRAPLRGIDGFSQALLEDYSDKLDAEGQDHLRRVRAASQRMGRLIDHLLQLSRMTRLAMHRDTVDLSTIASRVVAELQAAEPARRVEICVTPGLSANGDIHLLEMVLVNLLGNAWKFTSKTENARIEFGVTEHEGQRAFFVRDNGAGFDMAYADRLFGAFQRLHSNEEFPGTGIGLATVQRIIRRHGGQIWAESAVGSGAVFFFTLGSNGGKA